MRIHQDQARREGEKERGDEGESAVTVVEGRTVLGEVNTLLRLHEVVQKVWTESPVKECPVRLEMTRIRQLSRDDPQPAAGPGWHGDGGCRDDRGCWRLSRDDTYTSVEPRGRKVGGRAEMNVVGSEPR
ncbi:hypothetical protein Bbelb_310300 [Branchiostoma belcheri]|nr:hypothetical protein Bbelb_310300 [Branchiostoma belcheri]